MTPTPSRPKGCATPTPLPNGWRFAPEWFCLNPEGAGLKVSEMYLRNAQWFARERSGESRTVTADLDGDASEADREAARLRAEAEQAEASKRERRIVVTLNKLGVAATGVRRQFVTTLLSRFPRALRRLWPTAWHATATC